MNLPKLKNLFIESDKVCVNVTDDNRPDEKYDPNELKMGVEIEKEHTSDERLALKITKDHLDENPKYYTDFKKAKIESLDDNETMSLKDAAIPKPKKDTSTYTPDPETSTWSASPASKKMPSLANVMKSPVPTSTPKKVAQTAKPSAEFPKQSKPMSSAELDKFLEPYKSKTSQDVPKTTQQQSKDKSSMPSMKTIYAPPPPALKKTLPKKVTSKSPDKMPSLVRVAQAASPSAIPNMPQWEKKPAISPTEDKPEDLDISKIVSKAKETAPIQKLKQNYRRFPTNDWSIGGKVDVYGTKGKIVGKIGDIWKILGDNGKMYTWGNKGSSRAGLRRL